MTIEKEMFGLVDLTKGVLTPEQTIDLAVSMLAISKGEASILRTLATKGNIADKLLTQIQQIPVGSTSIEELSERVKQATTVLPITELAMALAQLLELSTAGELVDQLITHFNKSAMGMITIPKQLTNIVSSYFDMSVNSTLHSATMGFGMAASDLMKENPSVSFYGQALNRHALMLAELRFYLKNVDAQLMYGDVISKPEFVEGDRLQQFDFVYMAPPFGMKLNTEQEQALERDTFSRFDYYGKPSKANLDLAYVVSGLGALKEDGKAAFLMPTGALYRAGADQKIRERFIFADVIEAIIQLPPGLLLPYTGISTALVLFNKNKPSQRQNEIIMINVENLYKNGPLRTNVLTEEAVKLIEQALVSSDEAAQINCIVSNDELKDAQLLPSRYVFEKEMEFDEYGVVKFDLTAFEKIHTASLEKLTTLFRGYNALPRNIEENGPYAVLKIADVENGEINYDGLTYYKVEERTKVDSYRIQKGDVILSIRGQSLKVAIFEQDRENVLLSQNFIGIRCGRELDPAFLKMYFESPTVQFIFNSKLTGSTVMNLPIKEVEALAVPILNVEEQQRIVNEYKQEQQRIADEIQLLQQQMKRLKVESFNSMGIAKTFRIEL